MKKQKANFQGAERWFARSPLTGKMEEVDPEGELLPGERVVKLCYCARLDGYVSIPGASLLRVAADGRLIEERDDG